MGSKNYSRVNGKIVRAPIFLEPDDQIQFGDSTIMQFVTARRHSNEALPKPEKITNNLLVSIAYPQLLSKGRSSKFLVTFYNKKFTSLVKQHIENSMSDYQKEGILIKDEVFTATNLDVGKKLQVKLSSSEMDFSDEKAFQLNDIPSSLIFLGKPKETCRPDKHLVLLTVSQDGVEILSETCQIKIVDYAFDHISRPFLAQVGSLFIGISSLAAYMLALLEKTDTAFGFTTGTAGLFIAGSIYSLVYFRYQQLKKKLP